MKYLPNSIQIIDGIQCSIIQLSDHNYLIKTLTEKPKYMIIWGDSYFRPECVSTLTKKEYALALITDRIPTRFRLGITDE